jgi:hypothetical protein
LPKHHLPRTADVDVVRTGAGRAAREKELEAAQADRWIELVSRRVDERAEVFGRLEPAVGSPRTIQVESAQAAGAVAREVDEVPSRRDRYRAFR